MKYDIYFIFLNLLILRNSAYKLCFRYAGNIFKEPTLLIPGHADKNRLQPAYDELVKYIREVDQDRLVFFAGVTWDDVVPVGFTSVPGGDSEAGRSVFAFHFYEPPQTNDVTYFHQRMKDATRLQSGFMLTEFERPGNDADFIDDPFIVTTDEADKHLVSWSCWEYKTFCKETDKTSSSNSQAADFGSCKTGYGEHLWWDDNGNQNMVASRKLARTYAQKTAGRAKHMSFNATSADFEFKFEIDTTIVEPTEIFAHQRLQYPGGMKVTITPETSRLTWKMLSTNIIGVFPSSKTTNGETVTVKISNRT